MCLGIPGRILSITRDKKADVDFGGVRRTVQLDLLPSAKKGDYVMVHAGFAIEKISSKDARKTLALLQEAFNPGELPL